MPKHHVEASGEGGSPKKPKVDKEDGFTLNVNDALDKARESDSFREIILLPVGALQGLKAGTADGLFSAFKIKTIQDLANWKFFKISRAICTLASVEETGKRAPNNRQNINKALDKAHEKKSFKELVQAPVSALEGLAEWADSDLKKLRIASIGDLGKCKFFNWAEAMVTLAEYETADFSS